MLTKTFVYVSNGQDGNIDTYRMRPDGGLDPLARVGAATAVGPLAVSPEHNLKRAALRKAASTTKVRLSTLRLWRKRKLRN